MTTNQLKIFFHTIIFLILIYLWSNFWSQYGIDISDSGFFLHAQYRLLKSQASGISPTYLWIGSDYLGTLWLQLNSSVSLHFAKKGAYILYGIITIITYFTIYRITKNPNFSFLISLLSYILFGSLYIFPIIDYDLAPLLPISIILFLSTYIKKSETNIFIFFLIGILSFIIIFMRLPLLLFVSSLFLLFFYKNYSYKSIISFILGFIFIIILLILYPKTNNFLNLYLNTLIEILKPFFLGGAKNPKLSLFDSYNYTIKDQIFFWLRGYLRIIFVLLLLYSLFFVTIKIKNKKQVTVYNLSLILLIFIINYFPFEKLNYFNSINIKAVQSQFIYNYILSVIVFVAIYYLIRTKNIFLNQILIVLFTFVLLPIGSNSFEKKLHLSFFIIFPILYTLFKYSNYKTTNFFTLKYFIEWLLKIFALPLLVLIYFKTLHSPYRDKAINELNTEFKSKSLSKIFSTKEKVNAIDPVVNWFLLNKETNSTLLAIESTSIFNYLSEIPGVFEYPYPIYLSLNYFKSHLLYLKSLNQLPNFIIIPKVDISDSNWPINKKPDTIPENYKLFLSDFIRNNNYKSKFESDYFQIFERQSN